LISMGGNTIGTITMFDRYGGFKYNTYLEEIPQLELVKMF